MPQELARKNFKAVQREVEHGNKYLLDTITKSSNSSTSPVATLNSMITRMNNLKRKLETLHTEELTIQSSSRARLQHIHELHQIPSLADVKYDEWSRVRLNRLLVDYLLRNGYEQSARELAKEKGIEELVDLEAFVSCHKIEASLLNGRTQEALSWCQENKKELKKINVSALFRDFMNCWLGLMACRAPWSSNYGCSSTSSWSERATYKSLWKLLCMLGNISRLRLTERSRCKQQDFWLIRLATLPNHTR
jgi:hypothetical protein